MEKIVVGTVVQAKIGKLEEEVMSGRLKMMSKELTGVVQGVLAKKRFLVRFQDGCEKICP